MHTNQIRVERQRVKNLETLLTAQHYKTYSRYANKTLTLHIIRGGDHHTITFKILNPDDSYYLYDSCDITSLFVHNVINKQLNLDLKFDYSGKKDDGSNTSRNIDKPTLGVLIKKLMAEHYSLYWSYDKQFSKLHIVSDDSIEHHTLNFTKNHEYLTLASADVSSDLVKEIIEKYTTFKIVKSKISEIKKTHKHLYMEIDYHLMQLHEYIKENNHEKIDSVKNYLSYLQRQLSQSN